MKRNKGYGSKQEGLRRQPEDLEASQRAWEESLRAWEVNLRVWRTVRGSGGEGGQGHEETEPLPKKLKGHQETLTKKDFATVIGINPLCESRGPMLIGAKVL